MLIGLLLSPVIVIPLVPIPILVLVLLLPVFLDTVLCVQGHVLVLLLKLAVLLLNVGLVVVLLGDLVEVYRVQNPTFE